MSRVHNMSYHFYSHVANMALFST
ncbi:unnamed protein product, partial [Rotaria sp. Silwood1]